MLSLPLTNSGWSIYTTAFAGQTPCYSTPPLPLIPPTTSSNPANATRSTSASISIISTQIFTLQYSLRASSPRSSLSGGAKAGIATGVVLGVILAAALIFLLLRRRRRRHRRRQRTPTPTSPVATFEHPPPLPPSHISELPSPGPTEHRTSWLPPAAAQQSPVTPFPEQPPVELAATAAPEHELLPARAFSGFHPKPPAPLFPVELPTPYLSSHPAFRPAAAEQEAVSPVETPSAR